MAEVSSEHKRLEEQYDEREAKIGLKDGMGKTVWWLVGVFWDQLNGPNKRTFIKLELNRKTSATGLEMVEKQTVVKRICFIKLKVFFYLCISLTPYKFMPMSKVLEEKNTKENIRENEKEKELKISLE